MEVLNTAVKEITPEYVLEIRNNAYSPEGAAERVLLQCDMKTYPINVWRIAKILGFSMLEAHFKDDNVSGIMLDRKTVPKALEKHNAKRAIILNRKESLKKQAFTVAHEIGHFVLHIHEGEDFFEAYHISKVKNVESFSEEDKRNKEIEDEADTFAANLLMPTKIFLKFIIDSKNRNDKEKLISEISEAFMVEEEAVIKRFDELEVSF